MAWHRSEHARSKVVEMERIKAQMLAISTVSCSRYRIIYHYIVVLPDSSVPIFQQRPMSVPPGMQRAAGPNSALANHGAVAQPSSLQNQSS